MNVQNEEISFLFIIIYNKNIKIHSIESYIKAIWSNNMNDEGKKLSNIVLEVIFFADSMLYV